MNRSLLTARATKYTAYAIVYTAVVLGILGLVNWLASRYNKSVDTTANRRYSLSDQTEKIVRNLAQPVRITYFDKTGDFGRAKDLLDRYDNLSGRLSVDYVDPDRKPAIARAAGIRDYGTIVLQAGTQKQEAKSVSEEEITGAMIRLFKGGTRTVCSLGGAGEHRLDETGAAGYSSLQQVLKADAYEARSLNLLEKNEIPRDCTVVLVGGPKFDYPEPVVATLRTFVENGGRALFLVDPPLQSGRLQTSENALLAAALGAWGVTPEKNLVLETNPVGQMFGLGPESPLVSSYESHPIVREMAGVATAFPLVRSLTVGAAGKATASPLFRTSANSVATLNLTDPTLDPNSDKRGPFTLAAAGSYDTGRPNQQGRFVVVGSSNWVANSYIRFNGNRDLLLNMMNWLSSDEDLISIRPKDPDDRRLNLNRAQMGTLFTASVVLLPLAVVLAGVRVWWLRR